MLQINDLSFSYRRNELLFKNLRLSLLPGHIYGLLGKNGAGKSTLLKNMAGLSFPVKGSCKFYGVNVSTRAVPVLEDIYFLPEELTLPALSPARFSRNTAGFYPKFSEDDFFHFLDSLEVDRNNRMDRQSYGQQKKAMVAFGLATGASLLLLDEPTNGLDIPSKVQFRKLMASVQTESRCIVISTHQVRDLDSLIDILLVLHEGEIVVNCSMDHVIEKLSFGVYADTSALPVLYEEENFQGKNAILRNSKGVYGKADLELLFNGITSGEKSLLEILNAS